MMHDLTVIHVSTMMQWGGGEQQLVDLVEGLDRLGVNQLVVCVEGSKLQAYCRDHHVSFKSLRSRSSLRLSNAKTLARITKQCSADVLHVHESHAHTIAVLSHLLYRNKTPIFLSRKVAFPVKKHWFSRYKYNFHAIDKIVCVSNAVKSEVSQVVRAPEKLTTVYDGLDLAQFSSDRITCILRDEYQLPDDVSLIGTIGSLVDVKDHVTFLNVAKRVLGKGVQAKFLVIGSGSNEAQLKQTAHTLGLADDIIFTGFRNDVPKITGELDCLLMTSLMEGLPHVIIGACVAKTPVVSTNVGGIPELIEHGKTGWLAPVKEVDALCEGVLTMLNDAAYRERCVANASAVVVQQFSRPVMAQKMLALYRGVETEVPVAAP